MKKNKQFMSVNKNNKVPRTTFDLAVIKKI